MNDFPAQTEGWAGPPRFIVPPEPRRAVDGSLRYEGITYAAPIGYRPLQLDLWVPAGETAAVPLVVWIHGGAWLFGDRRYLPPTLRPDQLFDKLLAAGLAVATIDYRLSLEAKFPAQLHDAKAAVRYLRTHADQLGLDPGRVGVWGESAGGHLAAMVGLTGERSDLEGTLGVLGPSSAVDAVVVWYGPTDMAAHPRPVHPPEVAAQLPPELLTAPEDHLVGSLDPAAQAAASPVSYVTPTAPPFLLVHGTADTLVPYVHSELMHKALTDAGVAVKVVPVDGANHIFDGYDDVDAVVRRSVDFLVDALVR